MPKSLERALFNLAAVALVITLGLVVQRQFREAPNPEAEVLSSLVTAETEVLVAAEADALTLGAIAQSTLDFEVTEPPANAEVSNWQVEVIGIGPANSTVHHSGSEVSTGSDGVWRMPVLLFRGPNVLSFRNGTTGEEIEHELHLVADDRSDPAERASSSPSAPTTVAATTTTQAPTVKETPPTTAQGAKNSANKNRANQNSGKKNSNTERNAGQAGAEDSSQDQGESGNLPSATLNNPADRVAVSRQSPPIDARSDAGSPVNRPTQPPAKATGGRTPVKSPANDSSQTRTASAR